MKKNKRLTKEITTTNVDTDGVARIVDIKQETVFTDREPDYVKLYLKDIMRLKGLPESGNSILYCLLASMNYAGQIFITKTTRDILCRQLNIAEITLRKAIEKFVNKGLLTKYDSNTYVANPHLFARGKWTDVKKIRMLVEYSEEGRLLLNYEEYIKAASSITAQNQLPIFDRDF